MIQGIGGVQQRIQQLQTQLGLAPTSTATVIGNSGATASGGTSFASALSAASGPAAVTGTGSTSGDTVVATAKKYLGVPYVWGSANPDKGLDCSGLVQTVYKELGIKLPRVSSDQAKVGTEISSLDEARPGDILAFNKPVNHVAIYIGDNKMIAAPKPGDQVKIQKVYEEPSAIRRVLDGSVSPVTSSASVAGLRAAALRSTALGTSASLNNVPYADLFTQAAAKHGVSAKLLAAVAKVESGYNPKAVSPAGAQGLMQLMPSTARGLGVDNAFDPKDAINGAAKLLKSHLKEFGSLDLALAAYNAGGGAVKKHDGIPPYRETQAYVPKVKAALAALG